MTHTKARFVHYAVGIPEMDAEHYQLMLNIDTLKVEFNKNLNVTASLLKLHDLLVAHFEHEEAFMQSFKYPFFAQHVVEHTELLRKLNTCINADCRKQRHEFKFISMLEHIVTGHIDHSDRQYKAFFDAHQTLL